MRAFRDFTVHLRESSVPVSGQKFRFQMFSHPPTAVRPSGAEDKPRLVVDERLTRDSVQYTTQAGARRILNARQFNTLSRRLH